MDVLIYGIEHELQNPYPSGFARDVSVSETADRRLFAKLLRQSALDRRVSFIAEEQVAPRPSIPRQIAGDLGIRHEYVEMSIKEREDRKIPLDYSEDASLSPEQIQAYHHDREVYWVDRMESIAPSDMRCILVCGRDHLASVEALLKQRGHSTDRIDVRKASGFDLGWVKGA